MNEQFFRDRSGYLWELVEGARFEEGAYVKCVDGPAGTYRDGVQRLMHFDPDGPMQIGVANERPSREFYERRRVDAEATKVAAESDRATAQAEIDRVDAMEEAATTIAAVKLLNAPEGDPGPDGEPAPTPYEKRVLARSAVAHHERTITGADAAVVSTDEVLGAIDSLGRDFIPIPEVEAEVERLRATR